MALHLRGAVVALAVGVVMVAAAPAFAAWVTTGSGSATAQAGYWVGTQLRWTGTTGATPPLSGSCANLNSCSLALGNNNSFTTTVQVTDSSGHVVSNVGSGKTVTVSITQNQSGGKFIAPAPADTSDHTLNLPATGPAVTTVNFSYKASNNGSWTDKLTASSSGYASATVTMTKS